MPGVAACNLAISARIDYIASSATVDRAHAHDKEAIKQVNRASHAKLRRMSTSAAVRNS